MNKIKLIAIIGRSASGKDYLFRQTLEKNPGLNPVIHYTTRPRRDGEVEGKNYFFITEAEFTHKVCDQDFLAETHFRDWKYGIDSNSFNPNKINIGIFNPIELNQLYETFKDKFQFVIVETLADEKTRYVRSLDRLKPYDKEGLKELCRRNKADEQDFKTIEHIPRFSLNTTEPFAGIYNEGFMNAVVKLLGEYD